MSDRLDEILFKLRTFREVEHNDNQWSTEFVYSLDEAKQAIQSYIDRLIIEGKKETMAEYQDAIDYHKKQGNKDRIAELELLNEALIVVPNHETKEMWRAVPMSYIENRLAKLKLKELEK